METNNPIENVIIIGGGPAGLAAAVYTSRANLNPLLFAGSPPGGQLTLTTEVENYPGYESIMGPDLIEKMRSHAQKFGTRIKNENVLSVDVEDRPFILKTPSGEYKASSIIIATGAKALWLGLESETKLRGKGVSACATCDGFFFRNKVVAVVGGGDTALEEALVLTKFASKVYVIHRRDTFRASKIMQDRVMNHEKIEIVWNSTVEEIVGENKVEGIKLKSILQKNSEEISKNQQNQIPENSDTSDLSGRPISSDVGRSLQDSSVLKVDGVFIAIGHKPDTDLFKEKIELDQKGYVVTSAAHALKSAPFSGVSQSKPRLAGSADSNRLQQISTDFNFDYQTMTSVPGVFAGGDNVDHTYRQAATAVGMGVSAALDVERWLSDQVLTPQTW